MLCVSLTFVRVGCGQDGAVLLLDLFHIFWQLLYTASDLLYLHTHTQTQIYNVNAWCVHKHIECTARCCSGLTASVQTDLIPDLIRLLLWPDGIPSFWFPPPGSGFTATTGTTDPEVIALYDRVDDGVHCPLELNVPTFLNLFEMLPEVGVHPHGMFGSAMSQESKSCCCPCGRWIPSLGVTMESVFLYLHWLCVF